MSKIECRSCRYCVGDNCLNDELVSKIGFTSTAKNNRALLSFCGPDAKYYESFSSELPPKAGLTAEDFKHFDKETWLMLFEYSPLLRLNQELFDQMTEFQRTVEFAKLNEQSRIITERMQAIWDDVSKLDEFSKLLKRAKSINKKFVKLLGEGEKADAAKL